MIHPLVNSTERLVLGTSASEWHCAQDMLTDEHQSQAALTYRSEPEQDLMQTTVISDQKKVGTCSFLIIINIMNINIIVNILSVLDGALDFS